MRHTYLMEPGTWSGVGTFWREDGEPLAAECRTDIAHQGACWLICSILKVLGAPPVEFLTACRIELPCRKGACLKWTSENATLGKIQGTYSVLEHCILSVYRCTSNYHGAEHYGRVDDDTYQASGVLLLEERRLSSWELLLRRAATATGSSGCSDRSATPRTATSGT